MFVVFQHFVVDVVELGGVDKFGENIEVFHKFYEVFEGA